MGAALERKRGPLALFTSLSRFTVPRPFTASATTHWTPKEPRNSFQNCGTPSLLNHCRNRRGSIPADSAPPAGPDLGPEVVAATHFKARNDTVPLSLAPVISWVPAAA